MALKRFAPIGGRKNLVCQNLISAARRKSSVIFQSFPTIGSTVVSYVAGAIPHPIEGEQQTAGRHFVPIRRVGDGDCRIPRIHHSHDLKEKLALGRTNIEHSRVIRERIHEVINHLQLDL